MELYKLLAIAGSAGNESTVVTALTSAFTTAVSDIMSAIGGILPVVLPVVGAIAVVGIGIKIFKKVTGR